MGRRFIYALCGALALYFCACGDQDRKSSHARIEDAGVDSGVRDDTLDFYIFAQDPGYAELLQTWGEMYRAQRPGVRFVQLPAARGEPVLYERELIERMKREEAPDLVETSQDRVPIILAASEGKLAKLDDLYDEVGLRQVIRPEVIDNLTVSFAGQSAIYSVPVSMGRSNVLVYSTAMFQAEGLDPPKSVDELLAVCEKFKAKGIAPFAISYDPISLWFLLDGLMQGVMGAEAYRTFLTEQPGADVSAFTAAVDLFANILENYARDTGATAYDFSALARSLVRGEVAMFFDASYAAGPLQQLGWSYGIDFGVQSAPGASDLFAYFLGSYLMPADAPHPERARDFLKLVASAEAQTAASRIIGDIPVRTDVDANKLSPLVQLHLRDIDQASVRMLSRTRDELLIALAGFALDRDRAKLLKAYVDFPRLP